MRQQKPDNNVQRLSGFTLVELLVVIVILSILSALSLSGIMGARARGRVAKTQSTIRKLSEIVLPYYETYETRRPYVPIASRAANQTALRRLIVMELPERLQDITGGFQPLQIPGTQSFLSDIPPVTRRYKSLTQGKNDVDSADLLYMIVMRGVAADPDYTSHFRPDEMRDTDGNGLPEFIDGWNNPIKFLRWPVGFSSPVQQINGRLDLVDDRISKNGYRLVPLIYSAGVDGVYDVYDPSVNYRVISYDPFNDNNMTSDVGGGGGEVVLYKVTRDPAANTFIEVRANDNGATQIPQSPDIFGDVSDSPVQTVGSERSSTGTRVQSRDNIHNHDMTR